jgi:hypothetical protein
MGSKIEYIVLTFITLLIVFLYLTKPLEENILKSSSHKVLEKTTEISNFIEYEINATKLFHILKARNAYEVNNKWYLKDINITSESIKRLSSKEAISSKDKVIFLKDIFALKKDNTTYKSQKAIYLKKTKEFITPQNFILEKNGSIVRGRDLVYKAKKKETYAKDIKAEIKLKDTK